MSLAEIMGKFIEVNDVVQLEIILVNVQSVREDRQKWILDTKFGGHVFGSSTYSLLQNMFATALLNPRLLWLCKGCG
jgi:hypothetical protein